MDGYHKDKKYESLKIPGRAGNQIENRRENRNENQEDESGQLSFSQVGGQLSAPSGNEMYYEIDYDSGPLPGVGKYVLKQQQITPPKKDEVRELFLQMRNITRDYRASLDYSRLYNGRIQQEAAVVFYKQAVFMKDFTDDYPEDIPFSQYFPCYQMMGYKQLRTYFSWRTKVREGNVTDTSLSYAFLYIYELLANIGVEDPQEGLERLLFFWKSFRVCNGSIDKYVFRWLKDYHIYYELPHTFKEFVEEHGLTLHYPHLAEASEGFALFCEISKYDIRKSNFYQENEAVTADCFAYVLQRLKQILEENGIQFDESVFRPTKKMIAWKPFKDALFYPWKTQQDRRVILSQKEIYQCSSQQWTTGTTITSEKGRQLLGYIMKQMESELRKCMNYKYKLSAGIETVTHEMPYVLKALGLSLENIINTGVREFYRELTRTVVEVDVQSLERIRQEALATQEKLIVPEEEGSAVPFIPVPEPVRESVSQTAEPVSESVAQSTEPATVSDEWQLLKESLTEVETKALILLLSGEGDIKKYADECSIMLEVLIDQINEKAMDQIGDGLIDEALEIYEDYQEQVKELVE